MNLHAHSFREEPLDPDAIEALHAVGDELLKPRDAAVEAVRAAGRELVEFGLPAAKDLLAIKISEDRKAQRIHRVLLAWLLHHANGKTGIAFPGYSFLAELAEYDDRAIRTACAELVKMGYLVRTAGNKTGAHNRKGPSFGFAPAGAATWADAKSDLQARKERARIAVGHAIQKNVPAEGYVSPENVPTEWDVSADNVPAEGDVIARNVPTGGDVSTPKRTHRAHGSTNKREVEPPKEIELPRSEGEQGEVASPNLTAHGHTVVEVVGTELVPMSFDAPNRAGQLPLGDQADASGFAREVCRKLGIAEDDALAAKVAGTVKKALDFWSDMKPDARGLRRGFRSFDVYFCDRWFFGLSEDIRKLAARREITDRQISADCAAAERSLPAPDDGLGAKEYPPDRARYLRSLGRHVEIETMNGWIADANKRHGALVARKVDCDAVLGDIEPADDVPAAILWAAIKRVYGYDGGAVPVDHRVIEDVLSKHPNVPRDFAKAHVENCYADPAAVGMQPSRYNGAEWLAVLAKVTVDRFSIVLEHARKRVADELSLGWHSMAMTIGNKWPDHPSQDVNSICETAWTAARGDWTQPADPFAPLPEWPVTALAEAKLRLIELLDQVRERGPRMRTGSHSDRWHQRSCDDALVHVREVEWSFARGRLEPVKLRSLIKPKPGDLPSIYDGGWEY